jgi:hypothetical protein
MSWEEEEDNGICAVAFMICKVLLCNVSLSSWQLLAI